MCIRDRILNNQLVFFYKLSVGVVRLVSTNFWSPQQIASNFSRLASIKPRKDSFRKKTSTPVVFPRETPNRARSVQLCQLTGSGELKKMKLGLLQHICESFNLDVPPNKPRKKASYVTLIEELVSSCSCRTGSWYVRSKSISKRRCIFSLQW